MILIKSIAKFLQKSLKKKGYLCACVHISVCVSMQAITSVFLLTQRQLALDFSKLVLSATLKVDQLVKKTEGKRKIYLRILFTANECLNGPM